VLLRATFGVLCFMCDQHGAEHKGAACIAPEVQTRFDGCATLLDSFRFVHRAGSPARCPAYLFKV
jgi:hypothetical protein